jgi:glycine cleavage system H protein
MKVNDYEVPEDLLYTKEHEWVKIVNNRAVVGITDYAVKMLKDIVYVSLPEVGSEIKFMETFGTVESIKAASDIYSPLTGKVVKVNEELTTSPEIITQSPYDKGWLIEIEATNLDEEMKRLLNADAYAKLIEELSKEK